MPPDNWRDQMLNLPSVHHANTPVHHHSRSLLLFTPSSESFLRPPTASSVRRAVACNFADRPSRAMVHRQRHHKKTAPTPSLLWVMPCPAREEIPSDRNRRVALGQPRNTSFKALHLLRLAPAALRKNNEHLAIGESLVARSQRIIVTAGNGSFDRQNTHYFQSEP